MAHTFDKIFMFSDTYYSQRINQINQTFCQKLLTIEIRVKTQCIENTKSQGYIQFDLL